MVGLSAFVATAGCGSERAGVESKEPATAQTRQAYSSIGTERIIPVRVIMPKTSLSDPDWWMINDIQGQIEQANEVFKPAGVQFHLAYIERYAMPTFATLDTFTNRAWSTVKAELQGPFPTLSLSAWNDGQSKGEREWLVAASSCYGPLHQIIFWAHKTVNDETTGGTGNWGISPEMGRAAVHFTGPTDSNGNPAPGTLNSRYLFAHEAGHTLGLPHPHDFNKNSPATPWGYRDPQDGTQMTPSDLWDLVFKPGTGGASNVFFAERTDAEAQTQSALMGIQTSPTTSTCTDIGSKCYKNPPNGNPSDGTVQCTNVNGVTYSTGDANDTGATGGPALKGIGLRGLANPTTGINVMAYIGKCPYTTYSAGLSDSQIEMVRKNLRYQMPASSQEITDIQPPAGITLNTDRIYLGGWDAREQGVWLDFDGDLRRDLAVWDPPTSLDLSGNNPVKGTVRILTSRSSFATTWTVNFGLLGDTVMPNDYNGDGCTDIGVRRTSGPNGIDPNNDTGYFVYCPSTGAPNCGAPNCSNPITVTYGYRSDTPSPAPDFRGARGEIAVFRPSLGKFYWRTYVSGGANGGFPSPDLTATFGSARWLGTPLTSSDFDGDGKFDPAIWNTANFSFEILPSTLNYNTTWVRAFGGPGIPMEGFGILTNARPMLYSSGLFRMQWDVANNGPVTACSGVGTDNDFPITGIDRDGDWHTDMVLYSTDTSSGSGRIIFKDSHGGDCNGAVGYLTGTSLWTPGIRVIGTFDITGDFKPDIVFFNPKNGFWSWVTSESNYSAFAPSGFNLGTQKSVPL